MEIHLAQAHVIWSAANIPCPSFKYILYYKAYSTHALHMVLRMDHKILMIETRLYHKKNLMFV